MDAILRYRAGSVLGVLLSLTVGMPVNAQSPAPSANPTSAFDGTYVGVSAENNSSGNTLAGGRARTQGYVGARVCTTFRAPARLTTLMATPRSNGAIEHSRETRHLTVLGR